MRHLPFVALLAPSAAAAGLTNPTFDAGLDGWSVVLEGAGGAVVPEAGAARLSEGGAFLVTLQQSFELPVRAVRLSFRVVASPGLDPSVPWIPDAFEATLTDPSGRTLLPAWRPGAAAFFSLQEDGRPRLAEGVTFDGATVSVDLQRLRTTAPVTLAFRAVGTDADGLSSFLVDDVQIETRNQPPVAVTEDEVSAECGAGPLTLDGSASYDPDGDTVVLRWTTPEGEELAVGGTLQITPPPGTSRYVLVVSDPYGGSTAQTVTVWVADTTPPSLTPPPPQTLVAGPECSAVLPDLTLLARASDACGGVTLTADPPGGTPVTGDLTVQLVATDEAGLQATAEVPVSFTDPDGRCVPPGDTDVPVVVDTDTGADTAETDLPDETDLPVDTDPIPPVDDTDPVDSDTPVDPVDSDTPPVDTDPVDSDTIAPPIDDTDPVDSETDLIVPVETDESGGDSSPHTDVETDLVVETDESGDPPESDAPESDPPESDEPESDEPESDAPETDLPETDLPETDTPDTPGEGVGKDPVEEEPGECGCAQPGQPGAAALLSLALLRRRRRAVSGLTLVGALALAPAARAHDYAAETTPLQLGEVRTELLDEPDEIAVFGFTADPGERVYVDLISAADPYALRWSLEDEVGRTIAERTDRVADLPAVLLMGGTYNLVVRTQPLRAGDFSFRVVRAPALSYEVPADGRIEGALDAPGARHTWHFDAQPGEVVELTVAASTDPWGQPWALRDALGTTIASSWLLSNPGPITLLGGAYTWEISAAADAVSTYSVRRSRGVVTTSTIGVGEATSFDLPAAGSRHDVQLDVPEAGLYALDLVSASDVWAMSFRLADPWGNTISEAIPLQEYPRLALGAGVHTLTVATRSGSTGSASYRLLRVEDPEPTPLQPGERVTATWTVGVRTRYRVDLAAPARLSFDWEGGNYWESGWRLLDSAGRERAGNPSQLAANEPVAVEAGSYTLELLPGGMSEGSSDLRLREVVDGDATIALGGSYSGALLQPLTSQRLHLSGPGLVSVSFSATDNYWGTSWRLLDPYGRELVPWQRELRDLASVALGAGDHVLEVRSEVDQTASFTVDVGDLGPVTWVPTGTPVALGVEMSGTASSVPDVRTLDLTVPTDVTLRPLDNVGGLRWTMRDPQGQPWLDNVDASNSFWSFQGPVTLAPGTWSIEVTGPTGAAWRAIAEATPAPLDRALALGEEAAGDIVAVGEEHFYTFTLPERAEVYLDLLTTFGGLRLELYDALGSVVLPRRNFANTYWDDVGPITLGAGDYVLRLDPDYTWTGSYSLAVREVLRSSQTVAVGERVTGELVGPGDSTDLVVDVDAPATVIFDSHTQPRSLSGTLSDPQGLVRTSLWLHDGQNDTAPWTLGEDGWRFTIDGQQDAVGAFELTVAERVLHTGSYAVGDTLSADHLTSAHRSEMALVVPRDMRVYLDLLAGSANLTWTLLDPVGRAVAGPITMNDPGGGSDGGPWDLRAGTYTLRINPQWAGTGAWELRAVAVDTSDGDLLSVGERVTWTTPTPGAVGRYPLDIERDGTTAWFKLVQGAWGATWRLLDPLGVPVASDSAWEAPNDSLGPVPLKAGRYTVELDPLQDDQPTLIFEYTHPDPDAPTFVYTRYSGQPNVKRATQGSNNGELQVTSIEPLASLPGADGIVVAPDGSLLVGGNSALYRVDPDDGSWRGATAGVSHLHVALDPSGLKAWTAGVPGNLGEIPLVPFGDGVRRPLQGDDTVITSVAFDREGRAFYTASGPGGWGSFGRIDLNTFTTTRVYAGLPAAHGMTFDPYTNHLFLYGSNRITQIDPATQQIVSERIIDAPVQHDQGTTDGAGHAFVADNNGRLVFVDYARSRLVGDPSNYVYVEHLDSGLDDVAPMSWLGSGCFGAPPIVDLLPASDAIFAPGSTVLVSGRAVPLDPTRPVAAVLVDGAPAEAVDRDGRFFAPVLLGAGPRSVRVEAFDRCGRSEASLRLNGLSPGPDDVAGYADASSQTTVRFLSSTWEPFTSRLLVELALQNTSDRALVGPAVLVFGPELPPGVTVANPDGVDALGRAWIELLPAGATLEPGAQGATHDLALHSPGHERPTFTPRVLTGGNRPPAITSVPPLRAAAGERWSYAPRATDPDGHALRWELRSGPSDLSFEPASGAMSWLPGPGDVGGHSVELLVQDGFGGAATQRFELSVLAAPRNRPPMFTTSPPARVGVGVSLDVVLGAVDPDGDALRWSLVTGPAGMELDPSGRLTWPFAEPGAFPVVVVVSDDHGGAAEQRWTLMAGEIPLDDGAPRITTVPPDLASVADLYLYQPVAFDPDADPVTWALVRAPDDMVMDRFTGRLRWFPTELQLGLHEVELQVSDATGAVASQRWQVEVLPRPAERAPVFTTVASPLAVAGVEWRYDAEAVDPELGAVRYELATGPGAVDPATGVLSWTPGEADAGRTVALGVRAIDPTGLSSSQVFFVAVRGSNAPPVITGSVPEVAWAGETWRADLWATDPDGDAVFYTLVAGPEGMTVDPRLGQITWVPPAVEGPQGFVVRVEDGFGAALDASYTLQVRIDSAPPEVELWLGGSPACLDLPVQACVWASDVVAITSRSLTVDGAPVALDAAGCATLTPAATGVLALRAEARDRAGNAGEVERALPVADCDDTERPVVTLISPAPDAELRGPTEIVATIDDNTPEILSWVVQVSPQDEERWTTIAEGVGGASGALGTLDTTLLADGAWRLQIVADDGAQTGGIETRLILAGGFKVGRWAFSEVDLKRTVSGIPLVFTRSYDSQDHAGGDFGPGWRLGLVGRATDTAREVEGDDLVAMFSEEPYTDQTHIFIHKPDGQVAGFRFAPKPRSMPPFQYTVAFEPDEGVQDRLEAPGQQVVWNYGTGYLDFVIPYNPDLFVLTTREGVRYTYDEALGLRSVEDVYGNTLTVSEAGVTHSDGTTITFVRDDAGRITELVEPDPDPEDALPAPRRTYRYDALGRLAAAVDQEGRATTYSYGVPEVPHQLTAIHDPLGRRGIVTVYGDDGRVLAQCGPEADPVTLEGCATFDHQPVAGFSTSYDAAGYRTDWLYDALGAVITERHYLEDGEIWEISATYDDQHLLETWTVGEHTWRFEHDDQGRMTAETEPDGRTWRWEYDAACNLIAREINPTGDARSYTYDPESCAQATQTDELGNTSYYGWNDKGHLEWVFDRAGRPWVWTRDGRGNPLTLTDPAGRVTTWTWEPDGDLASRVDRSGRLITYTYDDSHRVLTETWDGARTMTWTWDDGGMLEQVSDPDSTMSYTWDALGQMRTASNAGTPGAPPVLLSYTPDERSQVATLTDSLGGHTAYQWDALRRVRAVTQTGGAPRRVDLSYDADGRLEELVRSADVDGLVPVVHTALGYDTGGEDRLVTVDHRRPDGSALHTISLTRDATNGPRAWQDAEGSHAAVSDARGALLSVDHEQGEDEWYRWGPLGDRQSSHRSSEHVYGDRSRGEHPATLQRTDAWTYAWSPDGELVRRTAPDGAWDELTWDHRRRLTGLVRHDAQGRVTHAVSWRYDAFDRRIAETIDGVTTWTVHDYDNPYLVLDDQGRLLRRRLYGREMDQVWGEDGPGGATWLLGDHQGSVRDVVDDAGAVLEHRAWDSFGNPRSGATAGLGFHARPSEPSTGFVDMRARTYDPDVGRFLSEDPLAPFGYAFAEGNPERWTDPTGKNVAIEYACLLSSDVATAYNLGHYVMEPTAGVFDFVAQTLQTGTPPPGDPARPLMQGLYSYFASFMGPFVGTYLSPPGTVGEGLSTIEPFFQVFCAYRSPSGPRSGPPPPPPPAGF